MKSQEDRYKELEGRISVIEERLGIHASMKNEEEAEPLDVPAPPKDLQFEQPESVLKMEVNTSWFTEEPLMKIGAILVVLGLAWFVRYAFVQNWIGPAMRIVMGIGFGTILMMAGIYLQKTKEVAGQVLLATGLAFTMVSVYAATSIYDFLTPVLALTIMTVFVAFTAIVAVMQEKQVIAILSVLTAMITPFLLGSPDVNYLFMLSYVALLNIFAFVLVGLRGWKSLYILSSLYTVAHTPLLASVSDMMSYWFIAIYGVQFYATITAKSLYDRSNNSSEIFSSVLILFTVLAWIYAFIPVDYQALVTGGVATVLVAVAVLFLYHKDEVVNNSGFLHLVAAFSYIFAATAFALDGRVLTIGLAIESLLFLLVSVFQFKSYKSIAISAAVMFLPAVMALPVLDLSPWRDTPFFNDASVLSIIITLAFIASSTLIYHLYHEEKKEDYLLLGRIHVGIAWLFSTSYVWFTTIKLLGEGSATIAIILVMYTVLGAILLYLGLNQKRQAFKRAGLGIIMLVVLRLVLVDVWDMELAARIASFVVIGALLMSTAFFQKQLRE